MTNEEKRKLAVRRELDLLRNVSAEFDKVVVNARNLAEEMRAGVRRLERIKSDQVLDQKIDELDKIAGRGRYAPALLQTADQVMRFGDLARDIARTYSTIDARTPFTPLGRYKVATDHGNTYSIFASSFSNAIDVCEELFPDERGMVVSDWEDA